MKCTYQSITHACPSQGAEQKECAERELTQALHDTHAQKAHELETARETFRNDLADIEQRYCDKRNQDAKVTEFFYFTKFCGDSVDPSFRNLFATNNVYCLKSKLPFRVLKFSSGVRPRSGFRPACDLQRNTTATVKL